MKHIHYLIFFILLKSYTIFSGHFTSEYIHYFDYMPKIDRHFVKPISTSKAIIVFANPNILRKTNERDQNFPQISSLDHWRFENQFESILKTHKIIVTKENKLEGWLSIKKKEKKSHLSQTDLNQFFSVCCVSHIITNKKNEIKKFRKEQQNQLQEIKKSFSLFIKLKEIKENIIDLEKEFPHSQLLKDIQSKSFVDILLNYKNSPQTINDMYIKIIEEETDEEEMI